MKGVNRLILNKATMITLVQEWINRNVKDKPNVVDVSGSKDSYSETFEVKFDDTVDSSNST